MHWSEGHNNRRNQKQNAQHPKAGVCFHVQVVLGRISFDLFLFLSGEGFGIHSVLCSLTWRKPQTGKREMGAEEQASQQLPGFWD